MTETSVMEDRLRFVARLLDGEPKSEVCRAFGVSRKTGYKLFERDRAEDLGLKKVDEGIWLVFFMTYDLGYIDLEQRTLQPLDNPFGTRLLPMS